MKMVALRIIPRPEVQHAGKLPSIGMLKRKRVLSIPSGSYALIFEGGGSGVRSIAPDGSSERKIEVHPEDRYVLFNREILAGGGISDFVFSGGECGTLSVEFTIRWMGAAGSGRGFGPATPDEIEESLADALEGMLASKWRPILRGTRYGREVQREVDDLLRSAICNEESNRDLCRQYGFAVSAVRILSVAAPEADAAEKKVAQISQDAVVGLARHQVASAEKEAELEQKKRELAINSYECEKELQKERVKREKLQTEQVQRESELRVRELEIRLEQLRRAEKEQIGRMEQPLGLQVVLKAYDRRGNLLEPQVGHGAVIRSGAFLRLGVSVDRDAWVYVLLHNAEGSWQRLVPDADIFGGFSRSNRQGGGEVVMWPPSRELEHPYWELNDCPGVESLIVVASCEPLDVASVLDEADAQELCRRGMPRLQRGVKAPSQSGSQPGAQRKYAEVYDELVGDGLVVKELSFRHVNE